MKKNLCPVCKQNEPHLDFMPFCSKLCRLTDLNRWLSDVYAIPTDDQADEAQEGAEDED